MKKKKIELLAPGGDAQSVKAAILAGADAVYLGVGEFNARKRAVNIRLEELQNLCSTAHQGNRRIYLTLNILALEDEFPVITGLLAKTLESGIDAVIIQDYGLLHYVRRAFPGIEVHASTQMTTHNAGQLKLLAQSGVSQVNLARELSLPELTGLTKAAHAEGLKAEVFVHGAYCVSFSGQCYISGQLYDNSANRGACVQPCRREYTPGLTDTGQPIKPLNLKDNSLFSHAARLYKAGVDSIKIEGRIKGYEYVFSTVAAWREQLDRLYAGQVPAEKDPRLAAVFNRSFSDNLIKARLGSDSFAPDSDDKSFELLGTVTGYNAALMELSVSTGGQFYAGQRVTIKDENGRFICTGTLMEKRSSWSYRFSIEHKLMGKILKGQQILGQIKVVDFSAVLEKLSSITAREEKIPLRFYLKGEAGALLTLHAETHDKHTIVTSEHMLEKATGNPTPREVITRQLSRLGNTPFYPASCDVSGLAEGLFISVKVLNDLRRRAVAELTQMPNGVAGIIQVPSLVRADLPSTRRIAVAVADREQLKQIPRNASVLTLFQLPADPGVLDRTALLFNDIEGLIPWFPSILIGRQYTAACDFLLHSGVQQIVTDNLGIACFARDHGIAWTAGPLLNGTNGHALDFFREYGASGSFSSSELNPLQFKNLTIPRGIELWSPLAAPVFLMKSRHCIVRNCIDCGKAVMDDQCLPFCSRWAGITDSQGNEILVIKNRGDFNSLYRKGMRLYSDRLQDPRIGTWVLDFRVSHESMQPDCSIPEFIEYARKLIGKQKNLSKDGCL